VANENHPYASTSDTDIANDSSNWIQLGEHTITAGTATFTATDFVIEADSADTSYDAHFSLDICWQKLMFTAYSSVSFQQQGTLDLVAFVQ
jgi:hypothetical protein